MSLPRIALIGAGLIGVRHAEAVQASGAAVLDCIADPGPAGATVAARHGVPHLLSLEEALARRPDGVILATPNALHAEGALACVAAGIPTLVEKPVATSVAEARAMVEAAQAAGVPLLVGHHRRHNDLVLRAKALIEEGRLGRVTAVQAQCWFRKPDSYFDAEWRRRRPGGGPLRINLIHDLDLLLHLCGPVASVQAMTSNAARGFEVEVTAALLLRFASGALGTLSLSDATVAPWSWELTARENPAYAATDQSCYLIGGTGGSLALPNLALWTHEGEGWWDAISASRFPGGNDDPFIRQVRNLAGVIRGQEGPVVTALDGMRALAILEAAEASAAGGAPIMPET